MSAKDNVVKEYSKKELVELKKEQEETALQIDKGLESLSKSSADFFGQQVTKAEELIDLSKKLDQQLSAFEDETKNQVDDLAASLPPYMQFSLNKTNWSETEPEEDFIPEKFPFGYKKAGIASIVIPNLLDFLGNKNTWCIKSSNLEKSADFLNQMIFRIMTAIPHDSRFCFVDPSNTDSLSYISELPSDNVRSLTNTTRSNLDEIKREINSIRSTYITTERNNLAKIPREKRGNTRFEFLVVLNYPKGLDNSEIQYIKEIANTGSRSGKYVLLHASPDELVKSQYGRSVTEEEALSDFENLNFIDLESLDFEIVQAATQQKIFEFVKSSKPKVAELKFENGTPFYQDPAAYWKEKASTRIVTPIGGKGSGASELDLWLGHTEDGRYCVHGMLAATTGAGKSNLYHAFILGLICRYSPEELNIYLIDGKQGVEFKPYDKLPHCKVVSLNTTPEMARSVLSELVDQMERRNDLFKRHGATSYTDYYEKGSPEGKIPRVVLLVDEYQILFENDREGYGSAKMKTLAEKGRNAGVHMFFGSQKFAVSGMQNKKDIFGNIHLRIAMKMTPSDVAALEEFEKEGREIIRNECSEAGRAVINHDSGQDQRNEQGKIFRITDNYRDTILANVNKLCDESPEMDTAWPLIIDGTSQPELETAPFLAHLARRYSERPPQETLDNYCRKSQHELGLGVPDWNTAEQPAFFVVGKELNVHGYQSVVLRNRANENILLMGSNEQAKYGMLLDMIKQLPINHTADEYKLICFDGARPGMPEAGILQAGLKAAGIANFEYVTSESELTQHLEATHTELLARLEGNSNNTSKIYIMLSDLNADGVFSTEQGKYGQEVPSRELELLKEIATKGSLQGIHLITGFENFHALDELFNKKQQKVFRHRLVTQIPSADSFTFLESDIAAKLQADGDTPVFAVYQDVKKSSPAKFKPFCCSSSSQAEEQTKAFSDLFAGWN